VAHIDTIREAIGSRNIERIVRVDLLTGVEGDGEIVWVVVSTASGTQVDYKCSRAAVKLVVLRALGLAGLCDCYTLSAFDVNSLGGRDGFGADGIILGGHEGSDLGDTGAALLEGRSQNDAGEDGEWEDEGGETHGVVI